MTIRKASVSDIPQISDIENRLFGDPWTAEQFETVTASQNELLLCAETEGQIAGYICMTLVLDQAYIENVAVDVPFRRQGIARKMLDTVCDIARGKNCPNIVLDVRINNTGARTLYSEYGFKDAAIRRNMYEHPAEDGITMIKEL